MSPFKSIFRLGLILLSLQLLQPQIIHAAGGDLDTTFTAGVSGSASTASVAAVQADGRVLVGGDFRAVNGRSYPRLVRLNVDGTIDQSFTVGTGPNASVSAIAVQPDGKILIGGFFFEYNGSPAANLLRLNPDGSVDATFNIGGTGLANASFVSAIALQSNGQFLIGGLFFEYNGTTTNNLVRLNSDGSLDMSFAANLGTGFDSVTRSIALQANGQIVIGGSFTSVSSTPANGIARLNPNGTLDTAFITNTGTGFNLPVNTVALQTDGSIVVGGSFSTFNGTARQSLARLHTTGLLDLSFSPATNSAAIEALQIQADGRILAAGANAFFGASFERRDIARLNATDGSLDLTFDVGAGTSGAGVSGIALQLDGTIFVVGNFSTFNNVVRRSLAKLNADGSVNLTFTTVIGLPGVVNAILIQSDNKILIGGDFRGVNETFRDAIARLNADGTTDLTFNPGINTSGFGVINAIAAQTDGKIIIGGAFNTGVGNNYGIARLNSDGSLDAGFSATVNGTVNTVAIQTDGKIMVGGSFNNFNGTIGINNVVRLNSDGSLDAGFSSGAAFDGNVEDIVLQTNGQILVAGSFTTYDVATGVNRIARLNSNGALDSTFTVNTGAGFDSSVLTLALQPDGTILAGGFFENFNGASSVRLARLNADGTLDTSFNVGTGFSNAPYDLAVQPDGRILAVGLFAAFNGIPRFELARLNTDGSLDGSFHSGLVINNTMEAVGLQSDGRIIIGGNLQSYDNTPRFGIARISAGDTITWTGALNNIWNNGANWSGGNVPGAVDNAIIPNDASINLSGGNFSVLTLTVGTNSTLTIAGGSSLTIEGGTNNGVITGAGALEFIGSSLGNSGTISVSAVNVSVGTGGNKALTGNGSFSGNLVTIASGCTLALQNNHQFNEIDLQSNAFLDATSRTLSLRGANPLQGSGFVSNTFGTIVFDGTTPQNLSRAQNFHNLTINNAAGVTLGGSTLYSVVGTLNLTNGILNVGAASALHLDDNAQVIRSSGYVTGGITKHFGSASSSFTFPLGTANGYSPVTVTITSGTPQITANVSQSNQPLLNPATSLHRYWALSAANGAFSANLTFNYLQGDVFGNENNYRIVRVAGSSATSFLNNCLSDSPCVNVASNTATINNITQFSDWTVGEPAAPTAAPATIAGRVVTPDGVPLDGVILRLAGAKQAVAITDGHGNYHFANVNTEQFYTLTPERVNYQFNPGSRSCSLLANQTDAVFTALPENLPSANPIDTSEFFVRQQYLDFLGREPDPDGLEYWSSQLNRCGRDAACLSGRRNEVSAAFFASSEFQQRAAFIYRLYRGALGRDMHFAEFSADRAQLITGLDLEQNRAAFVAGFAERPEFIVNYANSVSAETFVDALLRTASDGSGVDLGGARQDFLNAYNSGSTMSESRALVLRQLETNELFSGATYNRSFVLMEYLGYLRRDADANGYDFWLNVLDNTPGNYRRMVCAFLTSAEFQLRFGSISTRHNTECGR